MPDELQIPGRMIRAMETEIEVDVKERTLKRVQFMTRRVASDGGIVLPEGLQVGAFERNPVVLAMHGQTDQFPVIGRALSLARNDEGLVAATQFADTELGREIAYLYGVNERKEVYARAWSFGWSNVEVEDWSLNVARAYLGELWNEDELPPWVKREGRLWAATRAVLNEYSAVPVGADRHALSRAMSAGIKTAAMMVAEIDFAEAVAEVRKLSQLVCADEVRRISQSIKALRRDGAAAAARGDSAAVLEEVRAVTARFRATGHIE